MPRELERCEVCDRPIMRVRVNGQEFLADGMRIASVRIDQKPEASFLTGRIVETYPHHGAMCKPKEVDDGHMDKAEDAADYFGPTALEDKEDTHVGPAG